MTNSEGFEPDLDRLTRAELRDFDAAAADVAGVLDDWLYAHQGILSSHHNVGTFLDMLAVGGYRVERIVVPSFAEVLPAAVD